MLPNIGANRRRRWPFRCHGSRRESAMAQLFSLGFVNMRVELSLSAFVLCLLLLLGCSHGKSLTDADITDKLVGDWKVDGVLPTGVTASGTVSILRDGSLKCDTKFVRETRTLDMSYTGTWQVDKGLLIETIKTTSNSNLLAVGFVTRDKIIHLDDRKLVFEMESGNIITRERTHDA